jgi:hypothetical protein
MKNDLMGKFGMSEMEYAAMRILSILRSGRRSFMLGDMNEHEEKMGFLHLLYGQWLIPLYPNSLWGVSKEFLERAGAKDLNHMVLDPLDELGEDFEC